LGTGLKKVEDNEQQTVILQRRAVRAKFDLPEGCLISKDTLACLRPCPVDAIPPYKVADVINRKTRRAIAAGEHLRWTDFE